MQYEQLITDRVKFFELKEECTRIFDLSQRLPDRAFRRGYTQFCAFEYGRIFEKTFPSTLAALAGRAGDLIINYMTIEPDPVEYYRKYCGFYGLASFNGQDFVKSYQNVMSRDGDVNSFRARGGDVGVFWGSSLKWGIICDRISWELCMLGSDFTLNEAERTTLGCLNTRRVESYISAQYRYKPDRGQRFLDKFKITFPELD